MAQAFATEQWLMLEIDVVFSYFYFLNSYNRMLSSLLLCQVLHAFVVSVYSAVRSLLGGL